MALPAPWGGTSPCIAAPYSQARAPPDRKSSLAERGAPGPAAGGRTRACRPGAGPPAAALVRAAAGSPRASSRAARRSGAGTASRTRASARRRRARARRGRSRRVDVAKEDAGAALGQRVRVARGRVHPAQAVALERPSGEDRRGRRRRIDRREDVVAEARQGELLGGHRAARAVGRLEDGDVAPRLGQRDRGREPVRPRADDDRRAAHPAPQALGDLVQHARCSISP